jgi:hypothetical protein
VFDDGAKDFDLIGGDDEDSGARGLAVDEVCVWFVKTGDSLKCFSAKF